MSNKLPHTIEHFAAIKIRSMCSYAMIYEIRLLREKKTKSTYSTLPFLSDRQLLIENFWQPKEEIANAGCSEQDRPCAKQKHGILVQNVLRTSRQ